MIKSKQKNIRVFEFFDIEDSNELLTYIEKNYELLKDHLILIKGDINRDLEQFLYDNKICFLDSKNFDLDRLKNRDIKNSQKNIENADTIKLEAEEPKKLYSLDTKEPNIKIEKSQTAVFDRTIRSGELIEHYGDITIFGRINSGAKIVSSGNIHIYGDIDGNVFCYGEHMIVKKLGSGNIIFKNEKLDDDILKKDFLKHISIKDKKIAIKEM